MNWIKTSEQLPKIGQWVLATDDYNFQHPWKIKCYRGMKDRESWILEVGAKDWKKCIKSEPVWTDTFGGIGSEHPKAWMPLPEPYEKENE